jgi:methionyl-tRNA formyltransferase
MRVALFTSQDIGFELVDYFSRRADIDLLVVAYERPHDHDLGYRSALTLCQERGVPSLDASKADDRVARALDGHLPDIIVSAYYAKILPVDLLMKAAMGGINVHPGKLPFYKGRFPTPWYILNGEATFGIALHQMTAEVDAGDVYVQREFPIPPDMTGHELLRATMLRSAEVIRESFDSIMDGKIKPRLQAPGGSRYDHIEREHEIDWTQSAEMIGRQVRVHAKPYLPAYAFLSGKKLFINRARAEPEDRPPGTLVRPDDDGTFIVGCGRGSLRVIEAEWAKEATSQTR